MINGLDIPYKQAKELDGSGLYLTKTKGDARNQKCNKKIIKKQNGHGLKLLK